MEPEPEIVRIASEQMKKPVFTGDPIAHLEPGIPKAKKVLEENGLPVTEENLFIIGALATKGGNKGLDFLKGNFKVSVPKKKPAAAPAAAHAPTPVPAPAPAVPVAAAPVRPSVPVTTYNVNAGGRAYTLTVEECVT